MNKLYELFCRCLDAPYMHTNNSADYYTKRDKDTLYIFLECSNGSIDWQNNFDFPAIPYKRMGKTVWFCHRGFLRVWKSIEEVISPEIMDKTLKNIITVGYSHGAALATLCHEYIWYNRPDLRFSIEGYGFGSPRVLWGIPNRCTNSRWQRFNVIRNINDIVTFVPPRLFGYFHVGHMITIGKDGKYTSIDAHRPENILFELSQL